MNVPKAWLDYCEQLSRVVQTSQSVPANRVLLNILSSRTLILKLGVDILDLGAIIKVTRDSLSFDSTALFAR